MTPLLQTIGWALIHFLWQGAVIAGGASTLLRLTRQRSASVRYIIASASLLAMLAAPVVTARLMWAGTVAPADADANTATAQVVAAPAIATTQAQDIRRARANVGAESSSRLSLLNLSALESMLPGVTVAWLAGVLLLLARMTGGWWRVRRLHHVALATRSSRWQACCRRLAYRLGLPAAAHVVESALVDVPTVVGWLRPAIILPVAALASLTPSQIEAIIAHELAHIRRHDYAVNVVQTIAETLLFYHPGVWWLSNRIRVEREHCCDDIAVALCGDPLGYAQALAELETWRTSPTTMALAATGGSLLDRVRRILRVPSGDEPRSPSWAITLALTIVFTAGAGSLQYLPWITTGGDARAAAGSAAAPAHAVSQAPADQTLPGDDARRRARESERQAQEAEVRSTQESVRAEELAIRAQERERWAPEPPEPPQPPEPPDPPEPPQPPDPPEPPQPPAPPAPPAPFARITLPAPPAPPSPPARPTAPVPPAPPAPPAPPSPPSPPAPGAFSLSSSGDWHMQWSDDSHRFDVRLHGNVTFTDDLTDVQSMSDGGVLTLRDWTTLVPHTVEITSSNGVLTHTYFVAGLKRPWDEEAKRFLATQLPLVVRRSGIGAESRVKSIFQRRGINGVFEEIDLLGGDYARRLYLVALVDIAGFNATSVQPLLQRTGALMKSDYDRRLVLEHVAANVPLDRAAAASYVKAMASMKSDYDQRQALSALTEHHRDVADGDILLPALAHIKSSYDKRMVLEQALKPGQLSAASRRTVLEAVPGIQSDYDRRQVLTVYVDRFGVEAAEREPFFVAVRAIKSNYDRREVLTSLAKKGSAAHEVQDAVYGAVAEMTSDYDRAEVLLAFAPGVDAGTRQAFVSAAERIKSSHDQNRVLAALVKAERR